MTQEDKDLLLKDLCARLPYGVKVQVTQVPIRLSNDETLTYNRMYSLDEFDEYITIKPYLRPLSSMTEEESKEYEIQCCIDDDIVCHIDWLNEHHFDFRNLIEKGLAIEVTEENNPYKK